MVNHKLLLGMKGGGNGLILFEKYNIKTLQKYANAKNIKITKKKGNKIVNLTKEELINKIKKIKN